MSGGLDSSVASAILAAEGHEVIGVYLRLQKDDRGEERAVKTAEKTGFPLVVVPAEELFEKEVVEPFLNAYKSGLTPNPCIICNEKVKFAVLAIVAEKYGAGAVATGHYARIATGPDGRKSIFRGLDPTKDQSYMLYRIPRVMLGKIIFPLGDMGKHEVREKGNSLFPGLFDVVKESEDLCFVSRRELGDFVGEKAGPFPDGRIVSSAGCRIGFHKGLHRYTIGQRKGLSLSGGPWFVNGKNLEENELIVGTEKDARVRVAECGQSVWHQDPVAGVSFSACHRYRSRPVGCVLVGAEGSSFSCSFGENIAGVAPGQSLVLYSNDRVCGGGIIERTWRGGASDDE